MYITPPLYFIRLEICMIICLFLSLNVECYFHLHFHISFIMFHISITVDRRQSLMTESNTPSRIKHTFACIESNTPLHVLLFLPPILICTYSYLGSQSVGVQALARQLGSHHSCILQVGFVFYYRNEQLDFVLHIFIFHIMFSVYLWVRLICILQNKV